MLNLVYIVCTASDRYSLYCIWCTASLHPLWMHSFLAALPAIQRVCNGKRAPIAGGKGWWIQFILHPIMDGLHSLIVARSNEVIVERIEMEELDFLIDSVL